MASRRGVNVEKYAEANRTAFQGRYKSKQAMEEKLLEINNKLSKGYSYNRFLFIADNIGKLSVSNLKSLNKYILRLYDECNYYYYGGDDFLYYLFEKLETVQLETEIVLYYDKELETCLNLLHKHNEREIELTKDSFLNIATLFLYLSRPDYLMPINPVWYDLSSKIYIIETILDLVKGLVKTEIKANPNFLREAIKKIENSYVEEIITEEGLGGFGDRFGDTSDSFGDDLGFGEETDYNREHQKPKMKPHPPNREDKEEDFVNKPKVDSWGFNLDVDKSSTDTYSREREPKREERSANLDDAWGEFTDRPIQREESKVDKELLPTASGWDSFGADLQQPEEKESTVKAINLEDVDGEALQSQFGSWGSIEVDENSQESGKNNREESMSDLSDDKTQNSPDKTQIKDNLKDLNTLFMDDFN